MRLNAAFYALLLTSLAACSSEDRLKVLGIADGDKVIVMMDARTGPGPGGCSNDQVFSSTGETNHGNLRSSTGCSSEIAIFSEGHAMFLESPVNTWTDDPGNVHTVTLQPIIDVPVSVWVVDDATKTLASGHMQKAIDLYLKNKVGIRFVPTIKKISEVSNDPNAISIINDGIGNGASGLECQNIGTIQGREFYTVDTLNVYYVNEVFTGRNCAILQTPKVCTGDSTTFPRGDGNITFIGSTATSTTLAHEFGHAFGLRPSLCGAHTNGLAGFGPDNIMWAAGGDERVNFSLGQVFRMNTQIDEWGGTMLIKNGQRPGPGRACALNSPTTPTCPALNAKWP